LSEKVRRKPYSVVLLDEIEKAHPDVFNILLQVLDAGELTDGSGRKVDFRNTILIMTSNLGTREAQKSSGFGFSGTTATDHSRMAAKMLEEVKNIFRPEFLNRLDEIIVFRMLSRDDILKILAIYIEDLNHRLTDRNITITLSAKARDFIVDKGYKLETGARLLRRAVEKYLEDPLAEELIKGQFQEGGTVTVKVKGEELIFQEVNSKKVVEEN